MSLKEQFLGRLPDGWQVVTTQEPGKPTKTMHFCANHRKQILPADERAPS